MSIVVSVIILILSMLISFFMQLTPGTFALFYHYALGKTTTKKADDQSLSFITGTEIFVAAIWLLAYFLNFIIFYNFPDQNPIFFFIMAGIFFAEAIATIFFYYRKGKATALFLPRRLANGFLAHIKKAKSRSDCIILGVLAGFFELLFTFPLYMVSANIIINFDFFPRILVIILYAIVTILPLFILRGAFRLGSNLAEIERARVKFKPFIKIILSLSFLLLTFATTYLGVIYYGQ